MKLKNPLWPCATVVLLPLLAFTCHHGGKEPASSTPPTDGSGYVRQEQGSERVIVFMHGVIGGVPGTWTNSSTGAYWPALLTKDHTFDGYDIYAYDFESRPLGNSLTVTELAGNLESRLKDAGVLDQKEIIFLCHSMGGLVTREFLQQYQKYASKVKLIYFFSTPTTGSELGRIASLFSKNPQLGFMVPIDRDNHLHQQLLRWSAADFPISSFCAYEAQKTFGVQVVHLESASTLCNRPIKAVLENHLGIVKPKDENHDSYILFKNAFKDTRPSFTIGIQPGTTLKQAVDNVVKTDIRDGGNFTTQFKGCDEMALGAVVRGEEGGELRAGSREALIESFGNHIQGAQKFPRIEVIRHADNGYYEVRCEG